MDVFSVREYGITAVFAVLAALLFLYTLFQLVRNKKLRRKNFIARRIALCVLLVCVGIAPLLVPAESTPLPFDYAEIPAYTDSAYVIVNDNRPYFTKEELLSDPGETFTELDRLGRCGPAFAHIERDMMPTEERGDISSIKPSGWQIARYDDRIEKGFLYHRCHLIAYELTGQNANAQNLITGTEYMNMTGMLEWENRAASYLRLTKKPVLYRATPVFKGDELVARGVLLEAMSVDDEGQGLSFCVFCYNVQPGVEIDYRTGASRAK